MTSTRRVVGLLDDIGEKGTSVGGSDVDDGFADNGAVVLVCDAAEIHALEHVGDA